MTPAKPVVVGSFVVGALSIGVVAILVFGGMRFFVKTTPVMVVFPDSVAGLDVGSPVTFRGVPIGRVKAIEVRVDPRRRLHSIPVYIDLEPSRITFVGGAPQSMENGIKDAVQHGLRAQLISHGLVTGELAVNLDIHQNLPAASPLEPGGIVEIPSIPSDLQTLKDEFLRLDLPALGEQTREALVSLQRTLDKVSSAVEPLTEHASVTMSTATRTLKDIDRLALEGRGQLDSKGHELDQLLQSARRTTAQVDILVDNLNDLTDPHSELRGDLQASARDLAATSSDLRGFTEDLARSPIRTLMRSH
jgi:paraquat-inducible protein B